MESVTGSMLLGGLILGVIRGVTAGALALALIYLIVTLKSWHRRRKVDRRIVKQAKAAGVWDNPKALGGRALELHAWKWWGIKRQPGETDKELRLQCMAAAEEAKTLWREIEDE